MTTPEQQAVPVAQEDREAAHRLMIAHCGDDWRGLLRGEEDRHAFVQAFARHRLSLPCKSGEGAGKREAIARIVYEAMQWAASNREVSAPPSWVHNGNSFAQCEARTKADVILALTPDATQTREAEEWRENVEELLSNYDRTIRARPGGGPEDLILSLVLTFNRMKAELAALNARGGA